jgi:hypothetical protein
MVILKNHKQKITSVGENMKQKTAHGDEDKEKLKACGFVDRNIKWYSRCGKWHSDSSKIKHRNTLCFSSPHSGDMPKRTESRDSNRYFYTYQM